MPSSKDTSTVIFGGWYQRTTLHLSEVYGFLSEGFSKLDLSRKKLKQLQESLRLIEVVREVGNLEYVKATTAEGIEIRYYEDGLYILEIHSSDINKAQDGLEKYFFGLFSPAIEYLFSLGAPTPKVLANIKTLHPVVIGVTSRNPSDFSVKTEEYGEVYSQITSQGITVYKTPDYIFVVTSKDKEKMAQKLMEMQIFFREFKDQLEKYLNIHRNIWEEISLIKERQTIRGREITGLRLKLDGYQKTVNLISSRLNQMNTYIRTRASISKDLQIEKPLTTLFQYKFEILDDTHSYIREIWKMTTDYLSTAIEALKEIENRSANNTIKSIQILASIGVISGILGYLTTSKLPTITSTGVLYFSLLIAFIWPINLIISFIYRNLEYKLNFPERSKDL